MWATRLKIAKLEIFQDASFAGDLRDLKSTSGSTRLFPFRCCARSKPQFLTAVLDPSWRRDGSPALQIGDCVLETLSSEPAKGNLERHTRERVSPSLSHTDTIVFLSRLTTFHSTLPSVQKQSNSTCSKTMRQCSK